MFRRVLLVIAAVLVVLAGACGGDDASAPEPPTPARGTPADAGNGSDPTDGAGPAGGASGDASAVTGADGAEAGTFEVVGSEIFDPSGARFYPFGANVSPPVRDTEGACIWWLSLRCSDITGRIDSVQEWNWNTLRLNLQCGEEQNVNTDAPYGPDQMLAGVDAVVEEYTRAGIVVILDCHPYIASNPEVGDETWQELTGFWDLAIDRYAGNPYVWINFVNEFEATTDGDEDYFREFSEAAYRYLRDGGFEGVIVLDLPNFAQYIQFFDDDDNVRWAGRFEDVVWDWHAYGAVTEDGEVSSVDPGIDAEEMAVIYDRIIANLAENEIPVLVGEFGHDWNDQRREADGWSYQAMVTAARLNIEKLPDAGIGLLVWHANGSSGEAMVYGLKQSDDLTFDEPTVDGELSDLGRRYRRLGQSLGAS